MHLSVIARANQELDKFHRARAAATPTAWLSAVE